MNRARILLLLSVYSLLLITVTFVITAHFYKSKIDEEIYSSCMQAGLSKAATDLAVAEVKGICHFKHLENIAFPRLIKDHNIRLEVEIKTHRQGSHLAHFQITNDSNTYVYTYIKIGAPRRDKWNLAESVALNG
jgi:hypothetical protein